MHVPVKELKPSVGFKMNDMIELQIINIYLRGLNRKLRGYCYRANGYEEAKQNLHRNLKDILSGMYDNGLIEGYCKCRLHLCEGEWIANAL